MKFSNYSISELARITTGKSNSIDSLETGRYPFFDRSRVVKRSDKYLFDAEAIIIPGEGQEFIPRYYKGRFDLHQRAYALLPNNSIDGKFLYYSIMNKRRNFEKIAVGSTVKSLRRGSFEQIKLNIPDIKYQQKISSILSALDNKIEINNRINQTLEEIAQAIFKSWLIDFEPFREDKFIESELGLIPNGWRVGYLGDFVDFINGYAFKSGDLVDKEIDDSYHVFKMGHIKKGGGFNYDGTKSWIEREKCGTLGKYVLKIGDLLMCMTDMKGNVALLGHTALMIEDDKYIVNQRVGLLRINNDISIDYPYLYILTNSRDFIENLRGRANSGVQVNLSTTEIKYSKMIIAPEEINKKFNEIALPIFTKISNNYLENQRLINTRNLLLPKLMSGEILVPLEESNNAKIR